MYLKFIVVGIVLFLGFGVFIVLAQKDVKISPTQTDSESKNRTLEILGEQAVFSKLSSVEVETDEGFCILAVRKVIMWMNSPDDDDPSSRIKKELVQIELQAKALPLPKNVSNHHIQIGDKLFNIYRDDCKNKSDCIMVSMSIKEFDDLKDNALVTLSDIPIDPTILKELYKNGEPKEVYGVKFGRLDKRMIDKFPIVEINKP